MSWAASSARQPGHPWPEEISETSLNRFSKDKSPVRLTLVEPLVVEVAADVAWSGTSFRHPLTYQRARPDSIPPTSNSPRTSKPSNPNGASDGLCPLGSGGALCTAQAVPIGVQPVRCRTPPSD